MSYLPSLKSWELGGRKVLVRLGANVPVRNGRVLNSYRLDRSWPTLEYLLDRSLQVVVISHIENEEGSSLKPVADYLAAKTPTAFIDQWQPETVVRAVEERSEKLVVLENLRRHSGEKANDPKFAKQLAGLGDVYVNEAFAVAHRSHASIVGIPQHLPSAPGLLFESEVAELSRAFAPARPFVFILGGAKFDTKIPLVEKFADRADTVFIGGALAHAFYQFQGLEVGRSLVDDTEALTEQLSQLSERTNIVLPQEVVVYDPATTQSRITTPDKVGEQEKILDAGPAAVERLSRLVEQAGFVIWNGPLGDYLHNFQSATEDLARAVAAAPGRSILGGGDTVAAVAELDLFERIDFVSTGGGAMLDFLTHETLPGIEAMQNSR